MHQIVCRLGLCHIPTGGVYIAPPDSLAGLGVGPTGNGKEGEEGKRRRVGRDGKEGKAEASRNAQIQSWQAWEGSGVRTPENNYVAGSE